MLDLDPEQLNNMLAVMHAGKSIEIATALSLSIIETGSLIKRMSVVLPEGIPGKRAGIGIEIEYTEMDVGDQSEFYKRVMETMKATMNDAKKNGLLDRGFDGKDLVKIGPELASIQIGVERNGQV